MVESLSAVGAARQWVEANREIARAIICAPFTDERQRVDATADACARFVEQATDRAPEEWSDGLCRSACAAVARRLIEPRHAELYRPPLAYALSRLHSQPAAEDVVHLAFTRYLEGRCPAFTFESVRNWLFRVVANRMLSMATVVPQGCG